MNKKISIVVPTYNVEEYIAKCLDSLVIQDYDNFDVLVVNDGSPKNEQVIIDEYALKYPNIIKPIIKENGGYGSVLELAFKQSDAEYILICDPDDYLEKHALSTLYQYLVDTGADLVVGAKNLIYSDNEEVKYDKSFNNNFGVLEDKKLYHKENKDFEAFYFAEPSPHCKLYKRSLVEKIVFPHKVSYTDNLLYFYALSNVETVTYCKEPLAYYLINRVGNTRTDVNPKVIDAFCNVFTKIIEQVKNANDIFYYRMFETFYVIYYQIDNINATKEEKLQKYDVVYQYLKTLIPYKDAILRKNKEYSQDNSTMLKQKERLLTEATSRKMYDSLVSNRLNGSVKQKLKSFVVNNEALAKVYDKYHFHAKYRKTKNVEKIQLAENVEIKKVDSSEVNFFGYYDKPCIAYGHSLVHRVNSKTLYYNEDVDIVVDGKKVSTTNTWNWQQGAMSSWIDEKHIIHNYYDSCYFSKIVNIETLETKKINFAINALSNNKKFALGLNYARLAKLRPDYGYFNKSYDVLKDDNEDGIYYIDLINNEHKLLINLNEIKAFEPKVNMEKAIHKVNHLLISPNDDKAIFLHRWYVNDKKYTRLLCLNLKDKSLNVLADNEMVSHVVWYDNDTIFGYLRGNNNKDGYFFIDMNKNQKMFEHPLLVDDGHPTVYNDRYIVTDAYPDYTCMSKLLLIDVELNDVKIIGRFYSGKKYQEQKRCDLHPRFNLNEKKVTIDSVADGYRKVYEIDLTKLIKN